MIFGKNTEMSAENLNRMVAGDGITEGLKVYAFTVFRDEKGKYSIYGPSCHGVKIKMSGDATARVIIPGVKPNADNCTCLGACCLVADGIDVAPGGCVIIVKAD
jgi:hypothetical protein